MHRAAASNDIYRAIADPTRRAILDLLRGGPKPVNALAAEFAQTRPAISAHLRILREARIVSEQRAGRQRLYRLEPRQLREVDAWIETYRPMWESKIGEP